jgi:hypothetical protein
MGSQNKTQPTASPVSDYLEAVEPKTRKSDALKLAQIMKETTHVEPKMWGASIVGYGNYHYKYETGREGDTVAVGFSARKSALTIYGLFHYEENKENIKLAQKLGTHTHGKGCVYIKSLDAIDLGILRQMILNAYKARSK